METLTEKETLHYTYSDLLNLVLAEEVIVLTVKETEVARIKKGLAVTKSRQKRAMVKSGIPVDNTTLHYEVKKTKEEGMVLLSIAEVRKGVIASAISVASEAS